MREEAIAEPAEAIERPLKGPIERPFKSPPRGEVTTEDFRVSYATFSKYKDVSPIWGGISFCTFGVTARMYAVLSRAILCWGTLFL